MRALWSQATELSVLVYAIYDTDYSKKGPFDLEGFILSCEWDRIYILWIYTGNMILWVFTASKSIKYIQSYCILQIWISFEPITSYRISKLRLCAGV